MVCRYEGCGLCYANRRGRAAYKGHYGYVQQAKGRIGPMGLLERVRGQGAATEPAENPEFDPELGVGPATWEFLTAVWWEPGKVKRTPGTITVFADHGRGKVMLNDKDQSRVAFTTLEPSETVWDAAERALLSKQTDWRIAKQYSPPKK